MPFLVFTSPVLGPPCFARPNRPLVVPQTVRRLCACRASSFPILVPFPLWILNDPSCLTLLLFFVTRDVSTGPFRLLRQGLFSFFKSGPFRRYPLILRVPERSS